MLKVLWKFLGKKPLQPEHQPPVAQQPPTEIVVEGMLPLALTAHLNWHHDLPIPDWSAIYTWLDTAANESTKNEAYSACERAWLLHFAAALGTDHHLYESRQAMVLSSVEPQVARATLAYMERTLKRISGILSGLAEIPQHGKDILIMFDGQDDYYRYISYCYPEEGEFALSGGTHVNMGCSHFVTVKEDLSRVEPIIAHEMTHACLSRLPLPVWLNEGLAVNVEQRLTGQRASSWTPQELHEKHLRFWGESEIQEFWSGASFNRTDDGNLLSYDLARILVEHLARDWERFRQFVLAADQIDGGARAAREFLGISLGSLVASLFEERS